MKKLRELKEKALGLVYKSKMEVIGAACAVSTRDFSVYAADTLTSKALEIAGVLIDVFPAIGVFLVLMGGFKLFMALRNDQPEAVKGAAMELAIGLALIVFKTFMWNTLKGVMEKP